MGEEEEEWNSTERGYPGVQAERNKKHAETKTFHTHMGGTALQGGEGGRGVWIGAR